MLKGLMIPAVAVAVLATTVAANALTLKNRDRVGYTFTIYEGDDEWSGKIQSGETLSNLCVSACSISLDGKEDEETDVGDNKAVLILDGNLIPIE